MKRSILSLYFLLYLMLTSDHSFANNKIVLATAEYEPYIGNNLPYKGYAHELITAIYKDAGYEVTIEFYPYARAKFLAEIGAVDGYFPIQTIKQSEENHVYSAPFPGGSVGLLKKKSLRLPSSVSTASLTTNTSAFDGYQFGLVRGSDISQLFDATDLDKQYATDDLQNIDKLVKGRVEFIIADRYTIADLMAAHRPHLIGELEFLPEHTINSPFHIAFSKKNVNHKKYQQDFNQGLIEFSQNGALKTILEKHGLSSKKAKDEGFVNLTIGTVENKDMLIMKELSHTFEKENPKIKLQWRVLTETTLRKRLLSDLAISDGQFDVMTIGSYEAPTWAKRGWISPLTDFPNDYNINDIVTTVRQSLSHNNSLYALPFYSESSMTFYREDLFYSHGLLMPAKPSYQDIIHFAKTIHAPESKTYGLCIRGKAGWGENIAILTSIVRAYEGQWFNNYWQPQLNTPQWHKAVSDYIELITLYAHPESKSYGFNENLTLFKEGKCGLWIDATVAASMLFDPLQSSVAKSVSYASAPISKHLRSSHWLWSWALAIPESSKHKAEAFKFITWATSTNYISEVAKQLGWLSVPAGTRDSTYKNKDYIQAAPFAPFVLEKIREGKLLGSMIEIKSNGTQHTVMIPEFHALGDYIGQRLVDIIEGKLTIDEALEKSQKYAEQQMKNLRYDND